MTEANTDARRAAAKLLCVGFVGTTPTPAVRTLLEAGVTGCVLFARNVPGDGLTDDAPEVRGLTSALKSARPSPVLLCLDQEGGRVRRLRGPFTAVPPMRAVGATADASLAAAAGTVLGREVRWAGFDVNFAPDVDVDTNPANPVIADRSFGRTPELVSQMARALIPALQAEGVAACAKHFPGHGDTSTDSHKTLPRLDHPLARLESVELPPFKAAIDAGVASVMSAHVVFSPIDDKFPATMSRRALGDILRGRFGFDGVLFSDDLEMKALADHYALEDQLLMGHEAGIDLFLICHSEELQRRAIEILAAAIDRGTLDPTSSLRRIDALVSRYCAGVGTGSLGEVQSTLKAERARLAELAPQAASADPTKFK